MAKLREYLRISDVRYRVPEQPARMATGGCSTCITQVPIKFPIDMSNQSDIIKILERLGFNQSDIIKFCRSVYSSPMTSLVLTDRFEKLPDLILYPHAEPNDLQKHGFTNYPF
uniref:Uncharacterized protein n=1 Tax=Timema douglasi TaxID=61478 RepID=A0A7R8ZCQ8_TIMDO|nr:unnamed protein product [Timema douglasi]